MMRMAKTFVFITLPQTYAMLAKTGTLFAGFRFLSYFCSQKHLTT